MLRKISLVTIITILMMGLVVTSVKADGTATRTETVCDTGSYGVQNCHEVVQQIPTHTAAHVNTGIADMNVLVTAVGFVLILSTAAYIYTK